MLIFAFRYAGAISAGPHTPISAMKLIHTSDLHIGQTLYDSYDRTDEHEHFFAQLVRWCALERPDALIISGDIFHTAQPSAGSWRLFAESFVRLRHAAPSMSIVIIAGNHDSASRIESDAAVWGLAAARLVGTPPPQDISGEQWKERYIVRLPTGFIIALPYMATPRPDAAQALLDTVEAENTEGLPVVVAGHAAITGSDTTGHDFDIGNLRTQSPDTFGTGYDYLALGHIHRPQTIDKARYAGSVLHVSQDEAYPHTVSLVDIDSHGGKVRLTERRIDELRHFYTLPTDGPAFADADAALAGLAQFAQDGGEGYFRLRIDHRAALPSDFHSKVYQAIESYGGRLRYNPRTIIDGESTETQKDDRPLFDVAELQQMDNPLDFITRTIDRYPELNIDELREAFEEIEQELSRNDQQP